MSDTPTEALAALLEPGHDRMKDDAIGLDCCAECAEDWPCPTAILSADGVAVFTTASLAAAMVAVRILGQPLVTDDSGTRYLSSRELAAAIIAAAKVPTVLDILADPEPSDDSCPTCFPIP